MTTMQSTLGLAFLIACAHFASAADEPPMVTVITADEDRITGPLASAREGALTLGTDPPRSFQLADLERIDFGAVEAVPTNNGSGDLIWVGQDNQDLVQIGGAPGGNGVQDVHLRIQRLATKAIKQIAVVCRFPKLLRVWRLDTAGSPHWRLAIARSELSAEADLYIEPAADDSFGMKFDVTVIYSDGSTSKSSVTASTHTKDTLKVVTSVKPGETTTESQATPADDGTAELFVAGQGRLKGMVQSISPETLVLKTTWEREVQIPVLHIRGIWFVNRAPADARAKFDRQLAKPTGDDAVYLVGRDKSAQQVDGQVRSLDAEKLILHYADDDRPIKRDRVIGIVFTEHAKLPPPEGTYQTFTLTNGQAISGRWTGWNEEHLDIQTTWQATLHVPFDAVEQVRIRNGRVVYLTEMEPISVEEHGYFGRVIPWGVNRGFDGAPAAIQGKQVPRTLAMHSRCVLTYAVNGQYDSLKSTVGFDDSSQGQGRVALRILGDGNELLVEPDLRATHDPLPVDVSLNGVQQVTLEVDFGEKADIGDRVLWADPKLFRITSE